MIDLKFLRYVFVFSLTLTMMLSLGVIIANHLKERILVGKLKNIYYINTYDDWRNFSTSLKALTVEADFNTYATSEILFDDVFVKYYDGDNFKTSRFNHTFYYKHKYCKDNKKFSNRVRQKYVLDDLAIWVRGGVQCLQNWNKKHCEKKDYAESYIIFEVEDIKKFTSRFSFIEPDNYYITSLQFNKITYDGIKSYVHSYASKKADEDSNEEIKTIGKYWMFAVKRTTTMDLNPDSADAPIKYSSSRNIYIKYLKL